MPLFDFDCRACGRSFEALERRGGAPVVCPGCGSADLGKRITAPPLQARHRALKAKAVPLPSSPPPPGTRRIV